MALGISRMARALVALIVVAWLPGGSGAGAPAVLRVGTSGDYPPFSERVGGATAEPRFRGFDIEIATEFARAAGAGIEWVPFRWPELQESLAADRFDVAMSGVTVRPERSIEGRFTVPVAETGAVLLIRESARARLAEGDNDSSRGLEQLDVASLHVAVNAGGHLERVTRSHFRRAQVHAIPDNRSVPDALASGAVDAIVTDTLEAPRWLQGLTGVTAIGPFTRDFKAYWIAADDEALARRLDDWLLARERDGTLAARRRAWFEGAAMPATAAPLPALLAACDERLALMPFVAGFKRAGGREIVDARREEKVLAAAQRAVARAAADLGLPAPAADRVRRFYRAQIDAAVEIQRRILKGAEDPALSRFDLATQLRPALIRIGDRMAGLLVRTANSSRLSPDALRHEVARVLTRHQLSPERQAAIADAIAVVQRSRVNQRSKRGR